LGFAQDVLVNVAPKKANWDLKRDIEKKLEKLERRTQRALISIMQEEEEKRRRAEGELQN
jgi:coiled-coil domain-containing protein 12